MNLRAKVYVERQKKVVEEKLLARVKKLKEKDLSSQAMMKDPVYRRIKAEIRQAIARLAAIAAQEKLNRDRIQAKADKLAAEKAAKEMPKEGAKEEAAGKKEKKGKKEKPGKTEGKKEKKEKKEKKPEKKPEAEPGNKTEGQV
jgi:hypothetical protein